MTITINNESPRKQYTATGGETNFAGTWRIESAAEVKVYQTPDGSSPDDTTDLLTLTIDYTITGVGVGNSFTVILNTGATLNDTITIIGDINFAATYNFLTNGNFDPNDFNVIFSKFDRELKQLRMETRNLQLKYQNSEQVIAKDYKLPQLAANQSWRMDSGNTAIEAVVIGETGPGEQWYGVTTGVDTYVTTITDFAGYTTGETVFLQFGSTNTGSSTVNINGLGGKNLLRNDGSALQSGDLAAGTTYVFLYHDGQYYLSGQQKATESSVGISQIATTADVQAGTDDFKYVTPKKLRQDHPGNVFYVNTSGTANVYTGAVAGIGAYTTGLTLELKINITNNGPSTININGLGAKNLVRPDGTSLQDVDLKNDHTYIFIYDGTEFRSTQVVGASKIAWARFLWTGAAVNIIDSKGISSISRLGVGSYRADFNPYFPGGNYNIMGSAHSATNSLGVTFSNPLVVAAGNASFTFYKLTDGALTDPTLYGSVMFIGFI
jgi:hypothetical protein